MAGRICRRTLCLAQASAVLLVAGCGDVSQGSAISQQDSDGVRITDVARDAIPDTIAVDATPVWTVGDVAGATIAGDLVLHGVGDVLLLDEHTLLVTEGSAQQVVRVDLRTGEARRYGARGDGPHEFRGLASLHVTGGTRWAAWDMNRNRLLEFDGDDVVAEAADFPPATDGVSSARLYSTANGTRFHIFNAGFVPNPAEGVVRRETALVRLGAGAADTILMLKGPALYMTPQMAGGVLFGASSIVAAAHHGVWVGDTDAQEVLRVDDEGNVVERVRWRSRESRALTESRRNEFWARLEAEVPPEQAAALPMMKAAIPFADSVPAFGSIRASAEGAVWIGSPQPPERNMMEAPPAAQTWLVVNTHAGRAAVAATPEGFRLVRVGPDYLLGVYIDELGRQGVQLLRYHSRHEARAN